MIETLKYITKYDFIAFKSYENIYVVKISDFLKAREIMPISKLEVSHFNSEEGIFANINAVINAENLSESPIKNLNIIRKIFNKYIFLDGIACFYLMAIYILFIVNPSSNYFVVNSIPFVIYFFIRVFANYWIYKSKPFFVRYKGEDLVRKYYIGELK